MQAADNLMRTGVVILCPDCATDTVFVAPDLDDPDPAELACTSCGAAVLVEPSETAGSVRVSRVA